jgi:hypothetical protein
VLSSQILFGKSLAREAALGLNPWAAEGPKANGVSFNIPDGACGKLVDWYQSQGFRRVGEGEGGRAAFEAPVRSLKKP